jgi:hypothetical protein
LKRRVSSQYLIVLDDQLLMILPFVDLYQLEQLPAQAVFARSLSSLL